MMNVIRKIEQGAYEDVGKLVLRLTVGGLMLFHGISKLSGGIGFITDVVVKAGLPSIVAYGVYVGEVIAPILIIIGLYSRVGAAVIAVNMLFALCLVHTAELFSLGQSGGWAVELQGFYLFGAIAVVLLGPGRFSINSR